MESAAARRAWLRIALGLLLLGLASPAVARDLDLIGSWYVLVHYKDDNAGNADQERWEDKLWVFERKGRRLSWVEYPIVVFEDETGRFERRHTGQYARILHFWEPDVGQRAEIAGGLKVNSRGSKNKTLRGSDERGWTSGRRGSAASASVVTYEEVWSIEGLSGLPIFRRADFMGGGGSDTMEGLTEYASRELCDGGDLLAGTFVRDGTRHGTFQMMRAGAAAALDTGKSQREIQREGFRRSVAESPQIRAQAAADLQASLEESGSYLGAAELDRLAGETVQWALDGMAPAELRRRVVERIAEDDWGFLASGAVHDPSARYRFPFDPATPRRLLLGVGSESSGAPQSAGAKDRFEPLARHSGWARYSYKFELPLGSEVRVARAGEVVRVLDGVEPSGGSTSGAPNTVWIVHEDGSAALYLGLADGIPVRPGQSLAAGDPIGRSARLGRPAVPLLHFSVVRIDELGQARSVDIRFDDGSAAGLVPIAGRSYPGGGAGS